MGKDDGAQYHKPTRRKWRDDYHQDRDPSNMIFQEINRDLKVDRQKDFDYRNSMAQQLHSKGSWQHPAKTSILKEKGPALPKKLEWLNTQHITPSDQQKIVLDRLMANPAQQIMLRTQAHANKDNKLWTPHVFRNEGGNQMSSTAGAGCNKFHEFRQIRRNDRDREKFFEKLRTKEREAAAYDKQKAENEADRVKKLTKNQKKRNRMKANMKRKLEIKQEKQQAEQKRLKKLGLKAEDVKIEEKNEESSEDEDFDDIDESEAAVIPTKKQEDESSEDEDFDNIDENDMKKDSSSDENFDEEDLTSADQKIEDDDDFALDDDDDDEDLPIVAKISKKEDEDDEDDDMDTSDEVVKTLNEKKTVVKPDDGAVEKSVEKIVEDSVLSSVKKVSETAVENSIEKSDTQSVNDSVINSIETAVEVPVELTKTTIEVAQPIEKSVQQPITIEQPLSFKESSSKASEEKSSIETTSSNEKSSESPEKLSNESITIPTEQATAVATEEPVEQQPDKSPEKQTATAKEAQHNDDIVLIELGWSDLVKYGRITKKGVEIFDNAGKTPTDYYNMEPEDLEKFMTELKVNKRTMQAILKKREAWWNWAMGLQQ